MALIRPTTAAVLGVNMLVYLARHPGVVSIRSIAEALDCSTHVLAQVSRSLATQGYIRGYRGASGGFELAKEPSDISLCDVFEAWDGPLIPPRSADNLLALDVGQDFLVRWLEGLKALREVAKDYTVADAAGA